jgi:hypothetical protein
MLLGNIMSITEILFNIIRILNIGFSYCYARCGTDKIKIIKFYNSKDLRYTWCTKVQKAVQMIGIYVIPFIILLSVNPLDPNKCKIVLNY